MKNFILLILITSSLKIFACTCIETGEPLLKKVTDSYNQSDLVITGKVIDKNTVYYSLYGSSSDPAIYKIEIIKAYKGTVHTEIIEIASARSEISCGYEFKIGQTYLIYARKSNHFSSKTKNKSDFITSLCDRNQVLQNVVKKELSKLKKFNRGNKK